MFGKKKKSTIIESEFSFLIEQGFSLKKYMRPPDIECVYISNKLEIEADYYLGVLESYKETMCFDIILTTNGNRENLLKRTDIFGFDLINDLLMKIRYLSADEQVEVYAQFLRKTWISY